MWPPLLLCWTLPDAGCAGPHQTLPDDDGPGPCQMLAVIDPTRHWRGWTLPDAGCDRPYQTLEGLDPARRWLWSPEVNRSASCDAGSRVTGQLAHFKPNTFWILHTTYSCTADCRWSITDGGEGAGYQWIAEVYLLLHNSIRLANFYFPLLLHCASLCSYHADGTGSKRLSQFYFPSLLSLYSYPQGNTSFSVYIYSITTTASLCLVVLLKTEERQHG